MPVFDSNEFVKRMVAAGMPEGQAEVLAHENFELLTGDLATKSDLAVLRHDILNEFEKLRLEIQRDLAERDKRLLSRNGVMIAGATALLFTALSLVIAFVN